VEKGRFEEVTDIDFRLHREIVELARHGRLADQHANVMQQVRFHMVHAGFYPTDYPALVADHAALIEAIMLGDAKRAEQLARTHNEAEVRELARALQERVADEAPV
jgi:DNA-binding GntR family transcriptional regulator